VSAETSICDFAGHDFQDAGKREKIFKKIFPVGECNGRAIFFGSTSSSLSLDYPVCYY
jgi:hypothetical protein